MSHLFSKAVSFHSLSFVFDGFGDWVSLCCLPLFLQLYSFACSFLLVSPRHLFVCFFVFCFFGLVIISKVIVSIILFFSFTFLYFYSSFLCIFRFFCTFPRRSLLGMYHTFGDGRFLA